MRIIEMLAIIVNIISIVVLLVGVFHSFQQPKSKEIYGYFITGSLLFYIITLGLVVIGGFITKHNLYSIILFLCVISPFIVGKLVKHQTLKKYTVIQIACFTVSLVTMFQKYLNM